SAARHPATGSAAGGLAAAPCRPAEAALCTQLCAGSPRVSGWKLSDEANPEAARAFASLDAVFALQGEPITRDPLSDVIRVTLGGQRFYVKRYTGAGKGLRRYLGRPRVKAEWQNLRLFAKWGLPTATIIAY